jgi:phosphotransacetylase
VEEGLESNRCGFDGESQVDTALVPETRSANHRLKIVGNANVLIFPDLNSGNIASKLVRHIAMCTTTTIRQAR